MASVETKTQAWEAVLSYATYHAKTVESHARRVFDGVAKVRDDEGFVLSDDQIDWGYVCGETNRIIQQQVNASARTSELVAFYGEARVLDLTKDDATKIWADTAAEVAAEIEENPADIGVNDACHWATVSSRANRALHQLAMTRRANGGDEPRAATALWEELGKMVDAPGSGLQLKQVRPAIDATQDLVAGHTRLLNAAVVILTDPKIKSWLTANDMNAFMQLEKAYLQAIK